MLSENFEKQNSRVVIIEKTVGFIEAQLGGTFKMPKLLRDIGTIAK